jgi:hypothetical protein
MIGTGFSRVTHPFATRSSGASSMDLVRLACIKHAASVHPEPGSNSPTKTCLALVTRRSERSNQKRGVSESCTSSGICPPYSVRLYKPTSSRGRCRPVIRVAAGWEADSEIDRQSLESPVGGRRTARTGVLSSLPFSRSRSSGTHRGRAIGAEDNLCSSCVAGVGAGPFRRANPSVRRSTKIAGREGRATWLRKILPRGDATSCPSAAGGTARGAVRHR